jgi:hypothetical protein
MKFAFCVGNGESRRGFDIDQLASHGTVYGTNALFRDYTVDHLVCCDRRMAMETVSAGYTKPVYTREDWYSFFPYDNFNKLAPLPWEENEKWTQSFHMGSGLHAVNLALHDACDILVLIGHDFWSVNNLHNNIYKGTENYNAAQHDAVDPSFWIKQFVMFFSAYPDVQFVFCQPNMHSWRRPVGWDSTTLPNVQYQELSSLINDLQG